LKWFIRSHSTVRTPSGRLDGSVAIRVQEYITGEARTNRIAKIHQRFRRRRVGGIARSDAAGRDIGAERMSWR
jgi:hypothetical protein